MFNIYENIYENKEGETPLLKAVRRKSDKWIIEFLVQIGADVSYKDHQGNTALYYAIWNWGSLGIVSLLINNGANVNDYSPDNKPMLYLAYSCYKNSSLCELFIENGANLHCTYEGKRLFDLLCEDMDSSKSKCFKICRNALIKELYDIFNYTDYEKFKQGVVDSIDNPEVIVLETDHLNAVKWVTHDEKELGELKEFIHYFKSFELRERIIVDYLDVLGDQKISFWKERNFDYQKVFQN